MFVIPGVIAAILALTGCWVLVRVETLAKSKPRSTGTDEFIKKERLPSVLQQSTLFLSEEVLKIEVPVYLTGVPDQVWLLGNGKLVITDTKTHSKTTDDDIEQISMYRILVEQATGREVADYGFVRLAPKGKPVQWDLIRLFHRNKTRKIIQGKTRQKNMQKVVKKPRKAACVF
jgi:hypothetical protein